MPYVQADLVQLEANYKGGIRRTRLADGREVELDADLYKLLKAEMLADIAAATATVAPAPARLRMGTGRGLWPRGGCW